MTSISRGAGLLISRTINTRCNNAPSTLSDIYPRAVEISTGRTLEPAGGGVCSGCSGDYAGDFEDSGELGADSGGSDCPLGSGGQKERQENRPSTEEAGSVEDSVDSECDWRSASAPGESGESAGEICEIMVSATRIVEVRVITANCREREKSSDAGAAETSGALSDARRQPRTAERSRANAPLSVGCRFCRGRVQEMGPMGAESLWDFARRKFLSRA